MTPLAYVPFERLAVPRPVHRVPYIAERCRGRMVLDLGCLDATALAKRDTAAWLHGAIAATAAGVLGIDDADGIPPEGLPTGPRSRIVRGDVLTAVRDGTPGMESVEVVVAGELIEHLPDTLAFLSALRARFPGRTLLCSTPNATALHNLALGVLRRESAHPDHLQIYSYKTLSTLCRRAGFAEWSIVPYHVYFTELTLRLGGWRGRVIGGVERTANLVERLVPLLSGGLVLDVPRM